MSSVRKKAICRDYLPYRARAGVLGVDIGVGMRRGEGEVDSVRMRKRGDGVRMRNEEGEVTRLLAGRA